MNRVVSIVPAILTNDAQDYKTQIERIPLLKGYKSTWLTALLPRRPLLALQMCGGPWIGQ